MVESDFYDMTRAALWLTLEISAPILGTALVSGLVIGLFQALTSIQEMTLTFVPKVICILGVFWITMGFMSESLVDFFQDTLVPMIGAS